MGRPKPFGKRKFTGNRFIANSAGIVESDNSTITNESTCIVEVSNANQDNSVVRTPPSSSNRKLSCSQQLFESVCEEEQSNTCNNGKLRSGFVLVDIELMSEALCEYTKCKFCESDNSLSIVENITKRKGLLSSLVIVCSVCGNENNFYSSKKMSNGHEVNIRFVYALRCIGKGHAAGSNLCSIMNLPKPPTKFNKISKCLLQCAKSVANDSMKEAAEEAVQLNNGDSDLAVGIDGTWHKRGHTSNHGVVVATSMESGKVLDIEILTKYCHICKKTGGHDNCTVNFEGASGNMEAEGAVRIFQRSIASRGARYKQYLGDGDSKGYLRVVESKPYGNEVDIQKIECIGHVQKRMGCRLRKLKKDLVGVKLSDGKGIGGAKRLTDSAIDNLQTFYGQAIRNNLDNLKNMKEAVWATFFHVSSTDDNPMHELCPRGPDTWCKYNRQERNNYTHHGLPMAVTEKIKPIYKDLAHPDLLKKCLHGKTQNCNEAFNNVLWSRVPKTTFVGVHTLELGLYDAVLTFNEGACGRLKVLKKLNIHPGYNTTKIIQEIDHLRVLKADIMVEALAKQARKVKRNMKRAREDTGVQHYEAGMF